MEFQWIGGPTFILEIGNFRVISDPMFSQGPAAFHMPGLPSTGLPADVARLAPLPELELEDLDCIVVSHLHTDHFDREAIQQLPKSTQVIAPSYQVRRVETWGFQKVNGLQWWQHYRLAKGEEKLLITAVPAHHSNNLKIDQDLGTVNGYVFQYNDSEVHKVYWTGDTVWFDEVAAIRDFTGKLDLLLPHMGAVGAGGPKGRMTLDAVEAARLVELFDPKVVIPIHHHTFSHYQEQAEIFQVRVKENGYTGQFLLIPEGEKVHII